MSLNRQKSGSNEPDHEDFEEVLEDEGFSDAPALGMCCICLMEHPTVRNIVMLDVKAEQPGIGCWGCLQCGLPSEGAVAVLCDDCLQEHIDHGLDIGLACVGPPADNKRCPLASLTVPFYHDMSKYPEQAGGAS